MTHESRGPYRPGNPVYMFHVIAVAGGPLATAEIAEAVDKDISVVQNQLHRLWRSGVVVRRRREVGTQGPPEYEYAVAPPGTVAREGRTPVGEVIE